MTIYPWLLLVHILAAMVWVGGSVVLNIQGSRARSSGDSAARVEFARSLAFVGPRVLAPAVIVIVIVGVWMVLAGAGWNFGQAWVLAGLALYVVALLIGIVYLGRIGIQLQRSMAEAAADTADARRLLDQWILGSRVVLLVLLITAWDMVFKPGL
jgi:uncharacterized membrane protein